MHGLWCSGVDQQSEHLTNRSFSTDGFWQGQVLLDAVTVATTVFLLDDVAGLAQVGDDPERGALGYAKRSGDIAQAHPGVIRDADQGAGMVGEEAPLRHDTSIGGIFLNLLASFARSDALHMSIELASWREYNRGILCRGQIHRVVAVSGDMTLGAS